MQERSEPFSSLFLRLAVCVPAPAARLSGPVPGAGFGNGKIKQLAWAPPGHMIGEMNLFGLGEHLKKVDEFAAPPL